MGRPSSSGGLNEIITIRETVVEKVRSEKALDFSGRNSRPQTGSLHPQIMQRLGLNEFSAF
jgi:hypothetical protein